MKSLNRVIFLFSLFVIASCGGGGGGGGGGGDGYGSSSGNMNGAPNITNTSFDISVQENQTTAFTVTASDPDGDTITFSLSGTDASLLSITSSGVVTFNSAPDYEAPSDANGDNVYEISATVSDGSLTDSENFRITVTNGNSCWSWSYSRRNYMYRSKCWNLLRSTIYNNFFTRWYFFINS